MVMKITHDDLYEVFAVEGLSADIHVQLSAVHSNGSQRLEEKDPKILFAMVFALQQMSNSLLKKAYDTLPHTSSIIEDHFRDDETDEQYHLFFDEHLVPALLQVQDGNSSERSEVQVTRRN